MGDGALGEFWNDDDVAAHLFLNSRSRLRSSFSNKQKESHYSERELSSLVGK